MVVSDALVPIWCQDNYNHHDDVCGAVHLKIIGYHCERRIASKKETDGMLVGFANIEFDVTI